MGVYEVCMSGLLTFINHKARDTLQKKLDQKKLDDNFFKPANDILNLQYAGALHFDPNSESALLAQQRRAVVACMDNALANNGMRESIGSVREILEEIRKVALNAWDRPSIKNELEVMAQFKMFVTIIDHLRSELEKQGIHVSDLTDPNKALPPAAIEAINKACAQLRDAFPKRDKDIVAAPKPTQPQ